MTESRCLLTEVGVMINKLCRCQIWQHTRVSGISQYMACLKSLCHVMALLVGVCDDL